MSSLRGRLFDRWLSHPCGGMPAERLLQEDPEGVTDDCCDIDLARTAALVRIDDHRHEGGRRRSTRRSSAGRRRRSMARVSPTRCSIAAVKYNVAGVMTKPDEVKAPPFWAMYVGVPKLEEAAAHIKRLGGSAHTEVIEVPSVGRMQMMMDPQGAAFYIYEPADDRTAPGGRAGSRRRVVARADDHRRAGGDEVLPAGVRLAAERGDGHGADGHVPDVQSPARRRSAA